MATFDRRILCLVALIFLAVSEATPVVILDGSAHDILPRSHHLHRQRDSPTLTWISPNATSSFSPGSTISASWRTADGTQLVSPSVQLCRKAGSSKEKRKKHDKEYDDEEEEAEDDDDDEKNTKNSDKKGKSKSKSKSKADEDDDDEDAAAGSSSGGQNCGPSLWPTVTHAADGTDTAQLKFPDDGKTSNNGWYLLMKDNFGNKLRSPMFATGPGGQGTSSSDIAQPPPSAAVGPDAQPAAQAPMAAPNGASAPSASGWASPPPGDSASAPPAPALNPASPASGSPSGVSSSAPAAKPPVNAGAPDASSSNTMPSDTLATRSAPPVAAFAVPLALVGAILLIAGFACWRHSRHEKKERARMAMKAAMEEKGMSGSASVMSGMSMHGQSMQGPYAFNGFSAPHGQNVQVVPMPLFMPHSMGPSAQQYAPSPMSYDQYTPAYERRHRYAPSSERSSVTHDVLSSYDPLPSPHPNCLRPADVHVRHPAPGRRDTTLFNAVEERMRAGRR